MSRLTVGSLLAAALVVAATAWSAGGEEREIVDTYFRQMAAFTEMFLKDMDPARPGFVPRNATHTHDPDPAYAMAYLYKTAHPLNPYYNKKNIRDTAIAVCDRVAATKMGPEWPLYLVCQVYDLLKDEIPEPTRLAWKAYAEDYVSKRAMQPFFYTSPNHEAWNALAVNRAGQVFGEQGWVKLGSRLMGQLLKMQNELGYFDEGPHHGPAMKYNQVQLAAMLLYHDYSSDPAALLASKKLADFMIRYSFPDGSPAGAFDGRQNYSLGYYATLCYGLDRWPAGKELNRRIFRTRKKWGLLDVKSPHYSFSDWYAYFSTFYLVDELRSLRPDAPAEPLPQDRDGYRVADAGTSFNAGMARRHGWVVALSAIESDVPRYSRSVYQLERQSRLDVWHEKAGLIIGGGPSMVGEQVPLANFLLLTGHAGVDCDFGLLKGGSPHDRQAVYFPRNVKATLNPDSQQLAASFGHGDFFLDLKPANSARLELGYHSDIVAARKAFVQLPLVFFRDSEVRVDGAAFPGSSSAIVHRQITIRNPTTGASVRITTPQGKRILLRQPVDPRRWYVGEHKDQRYTPYYQIALLSLGLEPAAGQSAGSFVIEVSP